MKNIDLKKYGFLRVASCSPELKIANTDFNVKKILECIDLAVNENAHFILFPELSISGYSCGDLFFTKDLRDDVINALLKIADATKRDSISTVVGLPFDHKGKLYNTAAFISCGKILGLIPKSFLCNTKEYYEERWFSSEFDRIDDHVNIKGEKVPFGTDILFEAENFDNLSIGIEICEDLWTVKPPSLDKAAAGATLLCNLSASNEYIGKLDYRRRIVEMQSGRCFSGYLYSSCGVHESTTDTIFSGHLIYAEYGSIISQNHRFSFDNDILVVDIDIERIIAERINNNSFGISKPDLEYRKIKFKAKNSHVNKLHRKFNQNPFIPQNNNEKLETYKEITDIQAYSLIRRLKHIGINNLVIGISGGSDSTLALLSAVKAFDIAGIDRKNIHAVTMPGFATSSRTKNNALQIIEKLNVSKYIIPISNVLEQHFKNIDHDPKVHNVVFENAQARARTHILMDLSNKFNAIVVGTGDLTEIALGWSTYNADQMSMYGLNSGIPKTLVKELIEWYADNKYSDLKDNLYDIIDTPVSPELIPGQTDNIIQESEKILGPYEIHDFFLYYFIRFGFNLEKIFVLANIAFNNKYNGKEILNWLEIFIKRFYFNQFKRSSMPDGIKIGTISLSQRADWRMPSDADPTALLNKLKENVNQNKEINENLY